MQTSTFTYVDYLWDDTKAASLKGDEVVLFLYRSNILGADLRITNYGGGNTSCKTHEKDPLTNEEVELMWIKGSGGDIGTLTKAGIGCHGALWDFSKREYHNWVQKEGFEAILAPIAPTERSITKKFEETVIRFGAGIHDSSAALLPYYLNEKKPFVLLSTGTWSIALNPFYGQLLTKKDLQNNCLNYMRVDGRPVRAARLFLGGVYKKQVAMLTAFFQKPVSYHKGVSFQKTIYNQLLSAPKPSLIQSYEAGVGLKVRGTNLTPFASFEEAYHQMMIELVTHQEKALRIAMGESPVQKVYIDGGFVDNTLFTKLLALRFPDLKIRTTVSPLGAAMVLSEDALPNKFLKRTYQMKKLEPQKRMY